MKHLLSVFLFIVLLPSTARGVEFDASLLSQCLALADNPADEALRSGLLAHKHIRLIDEALPTHRGISFEQISEQKERLQAYAAALPAIEAELPALAAQATELLDETAAPTELNIRIVCGAPYDAFGFTRDGETYLFVNLPMIAPDFFPFLLRHELWHVAFRSQYAAIAQNFEQAEQPLKRLAFIMLNEGVGQYYSFQRRVEPQIVYNNWAERTGNLFSLLDEKAAELAAANTGDEQDQLLWTAQAGVPFWKKWGAVTGAVITYRLKNKLGAEALRPLIALGPCVFLSRYQKEAAKIASWQPIPDSLVEAACAAS
ncbi:MAG: hypothetical protein COB37_08355 [Kordiimonadales bacterium]|nr:MAG: hypothetical protein COB37_08355 [Kordiimonadales bacterium]